ncbi:MAG: heavy metal sensor histidine kinase [Planctomycetes bacterium]|nr:heavy metal sensor histidine kinase [Planctomycetota bacterium]
MSRWSPSRSVRVRLTLWYAGALAAILILYAAGVYLFLRQNLYTELDRQLHDDFEVAEEILERDANGAIRRRVHRDGHEENEEQPLRGLEVWSRDVRLLYREGPEDLRLPRPDLPGAGGVEVGTVASLSGVRMRIRGAPYAVGGEAVLIRVARSEARLRHELDEFLAGMALGLPLAVVLACAGGYLLAARALAPVGRMATRARTITAERLAERLPVDNPDDELGQLGTVFNETLARLERSFETLRRFTADAAHELRTPLTALKSVGEVGLRDSENEAAWREVIGSMLEEADRLARLVDTLLVLTRADSKKVEVHSERLDLLSFARELVALLEVLADEKGQSIAVEGGERVVAFADPLVLRRAVINVIDNAIKYSPRDSRIRVVVSRREAEALLEVIDHGPGIPEEHRDRIFERFYRVDKARSRETGGVGLGLAIARWAVEANGGRIEVESQVGEGSRFRIRLPVAQRKIASETKGGQSS